MTGDAYCCQWLHGRALIWAFKRSVIHSWCSSFGWRVAAVRDGAEAVQRIAGNGTVSGKPRPFRRCSSKA
jgi:hypothetical protein